MSDKPDVTLFLTPLTGKVRKREFLVLDVESKDGFTQKAGFTRPFMVGVYDGEKYYAFFDQEPATERDWDEHYYRPGGCVDRAMRFILQKKYSGRHIYAHNAGRFDYLFFVPWLMHYGRSLGFRFTVVPVASSIQIMDVWRGNKHRRWRFLDSLRLIPTSLDKAAKAFGLKGKDKSALKEDLNTPETERKAWISYNGIDCKVLFDVLKKFHHYIETVLGGEVGITAPSTSMKLFRRKYLKRHIPRSKDTHEFIRESYKGGRAEPIRQHGRRLRYYDINSSYPRAMLEKMPVGEAKWWDGEPPKRLTDGSHVGFVECDVLVPSDMHIPPLPVTAPKGTPYAGKLIFPTGRLSGIWEWDELQMAVEHGCRIEKFKRSVWYAADYLFVDFINDLYQYRDKSRPDYEEGLADVAKNMMNSHYGKYGMKTLRRQMYLWDDEELPDNAVPANGDPDCPVWYAEVESDAVYVMPQISARITSLARQRLYRGMMMVLKRGGAVYYCDTDSIVCDVEIPTSNALGEWKDEYPEQSGKLEGRFIAPKLYLLDGPGGFSKVKAKGIESVLKTRETFERLERGETITMKRLEKVGALAQAGFLRGPKMKQVPRTFLAQGAKRHIHEDGTTTPIQLDMW